MCKDKHTLKEFHQIAKNKGGTCLSIEYYKTTDRLTFKCCNNHIWEVRANHILEGTWCHQCSNRKYEIDHSFFSKDTEEAFYIAGFLAADGTKTDKNKSYKIRLRLAKKDLQHLENIKKTLKCTSPIKFEEKHIEKINNTILNKTYYSCGFSFNSKTCYNDLEKFGVIKNKTQQLLFPEWLKTHPLVHHYIRGIIDGDGSFILDKNSNSIKLSITGTKEFLKGMHQVFLQNNICKLYKNQKSFNGKNPSLIFGVLQYGGNKLISKIYDFLYKDATIFLERKESISRKSKINNQR